MDNIVFACIAPHGWPLVPLISGPDGAKARTSWAALEEMGRRMEAARPETVVIIEPHSLVVDGAISLLDSAVVAGEARGAPRVGAPAHSFALTFEVDRELNAAITVAARSSGVPVARVRTFLVDSMPLSLYWGSLIPLWYLGAMFSPPPKVVVAGAGIEVFGPEHVGPGGYIAPGVTREEYVGFGRAVRAAVAETGRRIAVIASVDLAHRHTADGPFGFDPAAATSDAEVVELVRANALDRLLGYDADTVDHALTEVVEPGLALHGLIEGENLRAEVLSYEVPNYFGMMCAAYGR